MSGQILQGVVRVEKSEGKIPLHRYGLVPAEDVPRWNSWARSNLEHYDTSRAAAGGVDWIASVPVARNTWWGTDWSDMEQRVPVWIAMLVDGKFRCRIDEIKTNKNI